MAAGKKADSPFTGRRHIVSMTGWDEDYFNEEVRAFIEFGEDGTGSLQFGCVSGQTDWRTTARDGEPVREVGRAGMVRPTVKQEAVEQTFPAIAKWVRGYGHLEIGDQEGFGFVVRARDYGGLVFEDDRPDTLAEAMAALEKGLAEYFEREGWES